MNASNRGLDGGSTISMAESETKFWNRVEHGQNARPVSIVDWGTSLWTNHVCAEQLDRVVNV